jgi:hypothetical protein
MCSRAIVSFGGASTASSAPLHTQAISSMFRRGYRTWRSTRRRIDALPGWSCGAQPHRSCSIFQITTGIDTMNDTNPLKSQWPPQYFEECLARTARGDRSAAFAVPQQASSELSGAGLEERPGAKNAFTTPLSGAPRRRSGLMAAVALKTPTIMGRLRPFGECGPSTIRFRGKSGTTTTADARRVPLYFIW